MSDKLLTPIEIGLTAAIVAIEGNEPMILLAAGGEPDDLAGLPFGPFDAAKRAVLDRRAYFEDRDIEVFVTQADPPHLSYVAVPVGFTVGESGEVVQPAPDDGAYSAPAFDGPWGTATTAFFTATNTDGGGLSSCHPGMRGIFLLIEAVRQLRGQGGAAQVPDCEVALAIGSGGWLSCIGAVLLGTLLSIRLSGHPALRALSLLSLAAIVALFAGYGRSSSGTIVSLAYGLVATALPVRRWYDARRPGVTDLLHDLRDAPELDAFVDEQLGPLLSAGSARHRVLLETLEVYLAAGGRKAQAARALHLERQSLYLRLRRIEEQLGVSLDDEDAVLGLHLAVRALAFRRRRAAA